MSPFCHAKSGLLVVVLLVIRSSEYVDDKS
jgi:hypothetical protein